MKHSLGHFIFKNRAFLVFIMTLIFIASSSVYAQSSQIMPTATEEMPPYELGTPVNNEITLIEDTQDENIIIQEEKVPTVQYLTGKNRSVETLMKYDSNAFFEHSVFVGDSITVGFESYCNSKSNTFVTDTTYFLARVSCSAKVCVADNALTKYANVMPLYQDNPQYVEKAISQIGGIEKVFLCYGVNDLVASSPQEFNQNLELLVNRILSNNPGVEIYIISTPCVVEDVSTGYLTNSSIMAANQILQNTCAEHKWGFINLTEYLMNEHLAIRPEYSADGYVHENANAYDIWIKVLLNYANENQSQI